MRSRPRPAVRAAPLAAPLAALLLASAAPRADPAGAAQPPSALWHDRTRALLGETAEWTNKVEVADLNGDGRPDLLFANGGDYDRPGTPEPTRVFLNQGAGRPFREATAEVVGAGGSLARVVKVRDVTGDGVPDIFIGTTYQTQSRLLVGQGGGRFREVTATHLPRRPASVGDAELGDVDGDGDLDLVLADWGAGSPMTNAGGRTVLWLNDGSGRFADATDARMPDALVRFSWDLELVDYDNDFDLDVLVSCKRCGGGELFENDGAGRFTNESRRLPQYANNYEFEAMDVNGDGWLDLVTLNDGEIVDGQPAHRREHLFVGDSLRSGHRVFRDRTPALWPERENPGHDDNMAAFLDVDSDGDADVVIGSLDGPDRLLVNDGVGRLAVAADVFAGDATPGTLALALADLDGDRRLDVVMAQGEHETAVAEKVFLGTGLRPDVAPPAIGRVAVAPDRAGGVLVRVRAHDRKSPSMPHDWRAVAVEWQDGARGGSVPMRWYGEYLWRASVPAAAAAGTLRVCATDAAGNRACSDRQPGPAGAPPAGGRAGR